MQRVPSQGANNFIDFNPQQFTAQDSYPLKSQLTHQGIFKEKQLAAAPTRASYQDSNLFGLNER